MVRLSTRRRRICTRLPPLPAPITARPPPSPTAIFVCHSPGLSPPVSLPGFHSLSLSFVHCQHLSTAAALPNCRAAVTTAIQISATAVCHRRSLILSFWVVSVINDITKSLRVKVFVKVA
uniref:Uncharacterized protein n=1 Tax=Cucumis melo TaxID=3656 RepID=A0A9I9E8D9_CUCME